MNIDVVLIGNHGKKKEEKSRDLQQMKMINVLPVRDTGRGDILAATLCLPPTSPPTSLIFFPCCRQNIL